MSIDDDAEKSRNRNPDLLLTQDEVVSAVREYPSEAGWEIRAWAVAREQGDDIVAEKEGPAS